MKNTVIVSTFNRKDALRCVLCSLDEQNSENFEVIVADDGSNDGTKELIQAFNSNSRIDVKHVWHDDKGFRVAKIRNKAVAHSKGDYIIFIDGDCVVFPDFVGEHERLAEKGYFVRGSRIMLSETFTKKFIKSKSRVTDLTKLDFLNLWYSKDIKRIAPLINLPLGKFRKLKLKKWHGAKTCNLAIWRDDFLAVNGFDEQFVGWGHEDADLVIRLINSGVYRKEGVNAVTVLHLWHMINDQSHLADNEARLQERLRSNENYIKNGVSQYL